MDRISKPIQVAVGIGVFLAVFWFLSRNQIVAEFMRPEVESGRLGVGTANALTSIIEILAAMGSVAIAVFTRLLVVLAGCIEPLVRQLIGTSRNADPDASQKSLDPKRLTDDLSRLLIQSVAEGNRELTIQLAHRLAGKTFLDDSGGQQP